MKVRTVHQVRIRHVQWRGEENYCTLKCACVISVLVDRARLETQFLLILDKVSHVVLKNKSIFLTDASLLLA